MKNIFNIICLLAAFSQSFLPTVATAASLNRDLAIAAEKLNKAHTLGSVLEALQADSELAGEFGALLREKRLDTNAPLPTFIVKGNKVIITGYSQPITFLGLRPLSVKVAGDTWTVKKGDTLTQAYDSLLAFMKTKSSKGVGYLYDLVIPSAQAGVIEILMGGLMGMGLLYAITGPADRVDARRADEEARLAKRDLIDELKRKDEEEKSRIAKEEASFVKKVVCEPKFSEVGKNLMAKNGPPKIFAITEEQNYAAFRARENAGTRDSDLVAVAWDFGDGHFETIEYQLKHGKKLYDENQSFKGYEGDFGLSAKTREGRPVHLFTRGSLTSGAGYDVYADNLRKNGKPLGSTGLQNITNKEYDTELNPWKMGEKDYALPVSKATPQQRTAITSPAIIRRVCDQSDKAARRHAVEMPADPAAEKGAE